MYPSGIEKENVKVTVRNLPISGKDSLVVGRKIKNMGIEEGKKFLKDMKDGRKHINGKHYTKACNYILDTIKSAEKNAEFKGIDKGKLKIKMVCVEKGPKRYKRFGKMMKNTHIKVVLDG